MKSTGIIRRIDELGRIVLPVELRRILDIKSCKEKGSSNKSDSDAVEIFVDGEEIILRKYTPGCHCCGNVGDLKEVMGLKICPDCLEEFSKVIDLIDKLRWLSWKICFGEQLVQA